jgi:hypothetical protein
MIPVNIVWIVVIVRCWSIHIVVIRGNVVDERQTIGEQAHSKEIFSRHLLEDQLKLCKTSINA